MYPTIQLYKHKNISNGKYPVIIQIIVQRKVFKKTLFNLEEKYWDKAANKVKSSHPLHLDYNDLISTKVYETEKRCIECLKNDIPLTRDVFEVSKIKTSIVDLIGQYQEQVKNAGAINHTSFNPVMKKILDNNMNVGLDQITEQWISTLFTKIKTMNHHNTAVKNIHLVQTVLRNLHKENIYNDQKVLKYKTGFKPSLKDKLSKEELNTFFKIHLPEGLINLVRDCFILSFCLRGLRIGDVLTLKKNQIIENRLYKKARKTGKEMDFALVPKALEIINKYKDSNSIYVLPIMTMETDFDSQRYRKQIEAKTALVNKYLKLIAEMAEIKKNVTTHLARHTFAYLADQSGMTAKRIMDLLDHSDLGTTQNYINDLNKSDMLDKEFGNFMDGLLQ